MKKNNNCVLSHAFSYIKSKYITQSKQNGNQIFIY